MPFQELINNASEKLANADRLVVLTGAGVSAESGIATFRDAMQGLWAKFNPEELASPSGFRRDPKLVWEWYEERRSNVARNRPNPAHYALAELEKIFLSSNRKFTLVTQNVDGFHMQAGSNNVLELHGNIVKNRCFREDRLLSDAEIERETVPPKCKHCGSYVRPGVVWFGENLPQDTLSEAFEKAEKADYCLVIGTSGLVQPAASIPVVARQSGAFVVEINSLESAITPISHIFLQGKAGETLPQIVTEIKKY